MPSTRCLRSSSYEPSSHFVFFFSSRRRHTRLQGDWSSDVCSSDLSRNTAQASPARKNDWQLVRMAPRPGPTIRMLLCHQYRRSEEHTSELQSPCNLVCRLLLEKKKKKKAHHIIANTISQTTNCNISLTSIC